MLVRIEVEFDDTTVDISQQDLLSHGTSNTCSGAAVLAMGRCAGRMIATLAAGTDYSPKVMVEEFHNAVLQATRSVTPGLACDEVGHSGPLPGVRSS